MIPSTVDEGAGRPVVLLHSLAQSGEVWRPLIDELAPRARVLAPDARGHGATPWDGAAFSVADLAGGVAELIDKLGTGPVSVAGMSMGGCIAIQLAPPPPSTNLAGSSSRSRPTAGSPPPSGTAIPQRSSG